MILNNKVNKQMNKNIIFTFCFLKMCFVAKAEKKRMRSQLIFSVQCINSDRQHLSNQLSTTTTQSSIRKRKEKL